MPAGRPTKYTPQLVDEICLRLSLGESLISICKDDHIPNRETIVCWVREKPEFSGKYTQARADQQDFYQEQILEIAADDSRDIVFVEKFADDGKLISREPRSDNTAVQRDKLRVDALKWTMSKVAPKKYGERITQELTGKDGEALSATITLGLKTK